MPDREQVINALRACRPVDVIWCQMRVKGQCDYAGEHCMARLLSDAAEMLEAQAPPTSESISSAIECLLHPQDADDSDMVKAIDVAVKALKLLKAQREATP